MKILVVDDKEENRYLLEVLLKGNGYEVVLANDGIQALERLGAESCDVIVSDILMPVMDGFKFCQEVKRDEALKNIPFIFYTATYTDEKDEEFALTLGADKFIRKPMDPDEFIKIIQGVIREMEKGRIDRKKPVSEKEQETLQVYSERLVNKLEQKMLDLEREVAERARAEVLLRKINRAYKALGECNQALIRATDEGELLHNVCRIIVEECGYQLVWIGFTGQDEAKTVRPVTQAGFEEGYLDTVNITWADTEQGRGPTGTAIRTAKPVINRDVLTNPAYAPWRAEAIKRGYASSAALPLLTSEQEVIGALNVYAAQPDAFAAEEIDLLMELAGDLAYGLVSLRVRAERVRMEEAIRESEELHRITMANILDLVFLTDDAGKFTFICTNVSHLLGYTVEEIQAIGNISDLVRESLFSLKELEAQGEIHNIERVIVDKQGRERVFLISVKRVSIKGGTVLYTCHDITERKQLEEQNVRLYEAERQRYREAETLRQAALALTSSLNLGLDQVFARILSKLKRVATYDSASILLLKGDSLEIIGGHGFDDLSAVIGTVIPAQGDTNPNVQVLETLAPVIIDDVRLDPLRFNQELPGASLIRAWLGVPLLIGDQPIGMLTMDKRQPNFYTQTHAQTALAYAAHAAIAIENARLYQNLQEQMETVQTAQAQLVKHEKLAATGRLAASLAHEISNPLQGIHNSLQLVLTVPLEPDEEQEYLNMADEEVERLSRIVTRILDFARPTQRRKQAVDVNETIEKTLALTHKYLQHQDIILRKELSPDLPAVAITSDELEQVFLNLVLNAVDAMPHKGTLRILSDLVGDGRLKVSFSDTGVGVSPEDLEHLFEPFYSTKEKGTGLGLSISYGVIERYGGEITVQSIEGEGTTFTVWLPVLAE